MKWLAKILAMVMLWAIVGYIVLYVDPAIIRDVIVPGMYLPMLIGLFVALMYTIWVVGKKFWMALTITFLAVFSVVLSIFHIMNMFLGAVIVAMILFAVYLNLRR